MRVQQAADVLYCATFLREMMRRPLVTFAYADELGRLCDGAELLALEFFDGQKAQAATAADHDREAARYMAL